MHLLTALLLFVALTVLFPLLVLVPQGRIRQYVFWPLLLIVVFLYFALSACFPDLMVILRMMPTLPEAVVLMPAAAGGIMLFIRTPCIRYALLLVTALWHNALTACLLLLSLQGPAHCPTGFGGLLAPDALGILFLALASLLFLAASVYGVGYLRSESHQGLRTDFQDGSAFTNAPEQRFLACMCFFLAAMSLVVTTQHLGALWVGIELTTLSSAPLIYFHRHRRSLEATWKYLMICSVGIALAFIGNILFTVAFYPEAPETLDQIGFFSQKAREAAAAGAGHTPWLKAGFIFLLVGYGTKMGLSPLHNWLPDAHSQAPSLVSALLSGALLNCAFLGILRGHQVLQAASLGDFSGSLLIFLGLLSMITAAIFIVGQGHYKRMLAYSSVEHMGILALGAGVGGAATYSVMLHAVNHSLTKCMLFLLAGNILSHYHTLSSYDARGLRWTMPITAALWIAGFFAIAGSPPFGLFVSEFSLLTAMFNSDHGVAALLYLGALGIIFVGLSVPVLRMVQGPKPPAVDMHYAETLCNIVPPLVLCILILILGVHIPAWLSTFLWQAAAVLGGSYGM